MVSIPIGFSHQLRQKTVHIAAKNILSFNPYRVFSSAETNSSVTLRVNILVSIPIGFSHQLRHCNKVDINLPEYPHLIELIRAHFNRFIVSRTLGTERERILQNRTTYESVSKITNDEEQKRAKRGLGIISRVFGGGDN